MTKQQAPAPRPKKVTHKLPSRGKYIDFVPRNNQPAVSRLEKAEAALKPSKTANTAIPRKTAKPPKAAPLTNQMPKMGTDAVRVSRTTIISTTKKKAPRRDFRPPAKEEDFDEDLLAELDFEEEKTTPVFTEEEIAEIETAPETSTKEAPEETPEDFMSEKTADEYASALTALKVTSVEESPFISTVSVDKRPLSEGRRLVEEDDENAPTDIREENFRSPVRNVYTRRQTTTASSAAFDPLSSTNSQRRHIAAADDDEIEPDLPRLRARIKAKKKEDEKPRELREKEEKIRGGASHGLHGGAHSGTRVVSPKDGHSGPFALIIAITLMVIFGGAVGAVIYLAFFQ